MTLKPIVTVRPATLEDAPLAWAARNDPEARKQSRQTAEIPLEGHVAWFARALKDPAKHLYVAEWDGVPVGTGRLDVTHGLTEVSVAILPGWRGRGHGSALVVALTCAAADLGYTALRAVARTANAGSLIAFLRAGYVPVDVWAEDGGEWIALDRVAAKAPQP